ncbi:MAG: tetratricopeptide repeat protein [Planctomycetaceae bacterium]
MRRSLAQFAICLVNFAVLTLITGCYSMNGYMMNSSGQAYYQQGNYAMAAAEFKKAVASVPSNPDYAANLARTRYKMGDVAGAEQFYRRNLTASPGHQPSYHGLAELMVAQGRGQEATAMLSSWTATQPYVAESHLELAWLQQETGQPDAAAQSLQQAMRVNPGHPKVLAHLGQYYQDQGQSNQAIAMYQQSLQSDWHQPQVHSRLAIAAAGAGPGHPMNSTAMARGAGPQGFGPRMATNPYPPLHMAQTMRPSGPYPPGFVQASQAAAMPTGMGFGFPTAAPNPAPRPAQQPRDMAVAASESPQPTPDLFFDQPSADPNPVSAVSHQTLMVPRPNESALEVEAF